MYAYVLSGSVTVSYASGVTKTFREGQALLEAVGVAHEGANLGRTDCRLLVVNIGAEGTANSVKL
jgi:quercetin dioxygenase-like cupin family protein